MTQSVAEHENQWTAFLNHWPLEKLPGLFIRDCPREADMSTGFYENFLSLIDALQKEQSPGGELPFQCIVTTTTPPPTELQGDSDRLILGLSSDDGLLFRRRFSRGRQDVLH